MLVDRETGEIFVYGPIGGSFWDDGITAELMIEALGYFRGREVTVRINSPGGIADEGIAIYNALQRHSGEVTTVVDAVAASAASLVALGGRKRKTSRGGKWMIHRAMNLAFGNATEMRKNAEVLETYDRSIVEIYKGVMPEQSAEQIEQMMDDETWFTGDEAMTIGLSTELDGETSGVEPAVAAWYKHAPSAIANSGAKLVTPKYPVNRQAAEIRNRALRLQFRK